MADGQRDTAEADLQRDEATLARYAGELADAVEHALPGWVERSVERRYPGSLPDDVRQRAHEAGQRAAGEVGGQVRDLLRTDIDQQWTNPLSLLRAAVRYPGSVLEAAGAPRPPRDSEAIRLHPDDHFDLVPAAFADVDPALHEPGLVWGAAKAHVHLARRRREGRR